MGVKINSRIITKNHVADPEIRFLTKSISKPYGRTTAMPTAWELIFQNWLLPELLSTITASSLTNITDNFRNFS